MAISFLLIRTISTYKSTASLLINIDTGFFISDQYLAKLQYQLFGSIKQTIFRTVIWAQRDWLCRICHLAQKPSSLLTINGNNYIISHLKSKHKLRWQRTASDLVDGPSSRSLPHSWAHSSAWSRKRLSVVRKFNVVRACKPAYDHDQLLTTLSLRTCNAHAFQNKIKNVNFFMRKLKIFLICFGICCAYILSWYITWQKLVIKTWPVYTRSISTTIVAL